MSNDQSPEQGEQERQRRLREAARLLALGVLRAHHTAAPITTTEAAPPAGEEQEEAPALSTP